MFFKLSLHAFIESFAIQLPADSVPQETVTGEASAATARTRGARSDLKRKRSDPNPERGTCNS